MKRNQSGFTLVEMMVTIVIGSLVTLAATTVLLLGLRINNRSTQTVTRQNTARVVITMLENLAAEGEINSITYGSEGWKITDSTNRTLVSFSSADQTIYTELTPLVEDVPASHVTLNKDGVLTFSLEKGGVSYNTSVYCRTLDLPEAEEDENDYEESPELEQAIKEAKTNENHPGRKAFLTALATQYRMINGSPNPGLELDAGGYSTGKYYTQWYLGGSYEGHPGWGPDTPWCACFVSWGLCHDKVRGETKSWNIKEDSEKNITGGVAFANVDFFWDYFVELDKDPDKVHLKLSKARDENTSAPTPGDVIFIDWDGEKGGYDPAHVGVVLALKLIDGINYVYTIEGNSAGIVAVRRYAINDPIIMGYGIIDWTE